MAEARINGMPPAGFVKGAIILETADGVRLAYALDPNVPIDIMISNDWEDKTYPDYTVRSDLVGQRIDLSGGYFDMRVWNGPMPEAPMRELTTTPAELTA